MTNAKVYDIVSVMDIEKAVRECPERIEIRLATSVLYDFTPWDIETFLKGLWRWN